MSGQQGEYPLEYLVRSTTPPLVLSLVLVIGTALPTMADVLIKPVSRAEAVTEQRNRVKGLSSAHLKSSYPAALLELARRQQAAGDLSGALASARAAMAAFDHQVELHKSLSDALPAYDLARAERATAHALGLERDQAIYLVAELAIALGDHDTAVKHLVLVIQSQPEQPLGQQAYAALQHLGWSAPPLPPASPPSERSPR